MKQVLLACCFALLMNTIWADIEINQQDVGSEKINQPAKRSPFSLDAHVEAIAPSKIKKGCYKGDKIHYAEAEAELGMVVYYCPRFTEGLRVAVDYSPTLIKWDDNPWFDQDHFNIATFSVSGFTKRLDRWFWRAQLSANFDAEKWSCQYTSYDIVLWGRYSLCRSVGIHFGFLAQTGLKLDRVYPIIGLDWHITKKLDLNLVYPMNISLNYTLTSHWKIGVAGRLISPRFRVHHNDHSHKPLVRYTNVGAEAILQYENDNLSADIHVGSTLGGTLRVADVNNNHARHYHLNPSLYGGLAANFKF